MLEYHTAKLRTNLLLWRQTKLLAPTAFHHGYLQLPEHLSLWPLTNLYLRSLREAKVYDDWKVARLNPIFKKDDESDRGNYRPLSMLSVPNKILESCVTDSIVDHVFTRNQLVTEYRWAYRKGHSTHLLLAHLTETWRRTLDSNLVVGVIFIDFQKAFDSISHKNLIYKLEHHYGIKGNLLAWVQETTWVKENNTPL